MKHLWIVMALTTLSLAQDDSAFLQVLLESSPLGQQARVDWSAGSIEVRGAAQSHSQTTAQAAANDDAFILLKKAVMNILITPDITVGIYAEAHADVQAGLESYLASAELYQQESQQQSDGSIIYHIRGRLPLYGNNALSGIVLPHFQETHGGQEWLGFSLPPASLESHHGAAPIFAAAAASYSGVVVDAMGFSIDPALAPRLVSEDGSMVYTINSVAGNVLASQGGAGYYATISSAMRDPRVGAQPLVVEVLAINRGSLIISNDDASILQSMRLALQSGSVTVASRGRGFSGITIDGAAPLAQAY